MLIVCPNCKKRFDIEPMSAEGAKKLRCSSCRAVFRLVRKTEPPEAPREAPGAAPKGPELPVGKLTVVIANESVAFCQAVQKMLLSEPFDVFSCNDGKEALETVERLCPEVLLLDVALPTMFGFEVCERVRQDPALSGVKIVLIASIYDKTRYKRSPKSLYGADDYIEKHHIPDSLIPMIYGLASGRVPAVDPPSESELAAQEESRCAIRQFEVRETSPAIPASPEAAAAPSPAAREQVVAHPAPLQHEVAPMSAALAPSPVAPMSAVLDPSPVAPMVELDPCPVAPMAELDPSPLAPMSAALEPSPVLAPQPAPGPAAGEAVSAMAELSEVEVKARRLARIIVSDIVLYNQGKVEQGVRDGSFYQLLADDIREGEHLYRQRVPKQVQETTSFLRDAFEDLIAKKRAELHI